MHMNQQQRMVSTLCKHNVNLVQAAAGSRHLRHVQVGNQLAGRGLVHSLEHLLPVLGHILRFNSRG